LYKEILSPTFAHSSTNQHVNHSCFPESAVMLQIVSRLPFRSRQGNQNTTWKIQTGKLTPNRFPLLKLTVLQMVPHGSLVSEIGQPLFNNAINQVFQ
jgi:hypothetical protein